MGNKIDKSTPKEEEFDFSRRSRDIQNARPNGSNMLGIYFQSPNIINISQKDHPEVVEMIITAIDSASKSGLTVDHAESELMVDQLTVSDVDFESNNLEQYRLLSKLLCEIIRDLMGADWWFFCGSDVSFRYTDISTLFFEFGQVDRKPTRVMYISLNHNDVLDIYLGSEMTEDVGAALKDVCQASDLVDQETSEYGESLFCLKLAGEPWNTYQIDRYKALGFVLELVSTLNKVGYDFIEKVNIHREVDCWFFGDTLDEQEFNTNKSRFIITLEEGDKLVLVNPPPGIDDIVAENLERSWTFQKLEHETEDSESVTCDSVSVTYYKIKGTPWDSDDPDTVSMSCLFLAHLFKSLYGIGFRVKITGDTSQAESDKSTFIMERSAAPRRISVIALNFCDTDKMRFISTDQPGLTQKIRYFLHNYWHKGLSMEFHRLNNLVAEFTFKGFPWGSENEDTAFARSMLCDLLTLLIDEGYQLLSSAEVSSKFVRDAEMAHENHSLDIDTWFLGKLEAEGIE